jgi:hypothetical protein
VPDCRPGPGNLVRFSETSAPEAPPSVRWFVHPGCLLWLAGIRLCHLQGGSAPCLYRRHVFRHLADGSHRRPAAEAGFRPGLESIGRNFRVFDLSHQKNFAFCEKNVCTFPKMGYNEM